jgi:hypothetical protein
VAPTGARESTRGPNRGKVPALKHAHRLARVRVGAAIALGAVLGLALGIIFSVTTDLPLAPEAGLVCGGVWAGCRAGIAPSSECRQ